MLVNKGSDRGTRSVKTFFFFQREFNNINKMPT